MVEQETKENIKKKSTWLRFLYMLLFAVIFNIAEFVVVVIVVVQFISKLFTGDVHARLQEFGDSVAQFIAEIVRYLTFHTEDVPFPFGEWPKGTNGKEAKRKRSRKKSASTEPVEKPEPPKLPKPPKSDDSAGGSASS